MRRLPGLVVLAVVIASLGAASSAAPEAAHAVVEVAPGQGFVATLQDGALVLAAGPMLPLGPASSRASCTLLQDADHGWLRDPGSVAIGGGETIGCANQRHAWGIGSVSLAVCCNSGAPTQVSVDVLDAPTGSYVAVVCSGRPAAFTPALAVQCDFLVGGSGTIPLSQYSDWDSYLLNVYDAEGAVAVIGPDTGQT